MRSMVMRGGELVELLAMYGDLEVRFVSCDPGGSWPRGKEPLCVTTEHDVMRVVRVGGGEHIEVYLHSGEIDDG